MMLKDKICPICGNKFLAHDRKKFCSDDCYQDSKRKNAKLYYQKCKMQSKNFTTTQKVSKLPNEQLHQLRIQRQQEAFKLGISYGQYVARFGGEFIP